MNRGEYYRNKTTQAVIHVLASVSPDNGKEGIFVAETRDGALMSLSGPISSEYKPITQAEFRDYGTIEYQVGDCGNPEMYDFIKALFLRIAETYKAVQYSTPGDTEFKIPNDKSVSAGIEISILSMNDNKFTASFNNQADLNATKEQFEFIKSVYDLRVV